MKKFVVGNKERKIIYQPTVSGETESAWGKLI